MSRLGDDDWYARLSAAEALGELGPEAHAAIPALEAMQDDPNESVRKVAAEAIQDIQEACRRAH